MSHYVFGIRGDIFEQQRLINRLSALSFFMPFKYGKNFEKEGKQTISGRIEPIQLFSYVFPDNAQDAVLTALGGTKENRERWYGVGFKNQLALAGLRKALWCKPIPEFKEDKSLLPHMPSSINNVSIMPIGIKKDVMDFLDPKSYFNPETKEWEDTKHEAL